MFFGDSHSRQFVGTSWGNYAHYVFSGATVKGLINSQSKTGHGQVIDHALSFKAEKNAFTMFGSVDFDFTLIREMCLEPSVSIEKFISIRVHIYKAFVDNLFSNNSISSTLKNLCVLCPHISPIKGSRFFQITAKRAKVSESEIRSAAKRYDISDVARARYIVNFNNELELAFAGTARVVVLRIDRAMLDDAGVIQDRFLPLNPTEHHAQIDATKAAWRPLLTPYLTNRSITG